MQCKKKGSHETFFSRTEKPQNFPKEIKTETSFKITAKENIGYRVNTENIEYRVNRENIEYRV